MIVLHITVRVQRSKYTGEMEMLHHPPCQFFSL